MALKTSVLSLAQAGSKSVARASSASHSPLRKAAAINSLESWLKNAGLPGFGDNETHGKIHSSLVIAAKALSP